jgi:prepilin-type processing-associated H-X9-DG protein
MSRTLVVGERTMARVPSTWLGVDLRGEDAACRLVGSAMTHPNCRECDECEFASRHAGGANFLWADGRVDLLSEAIDSAEYRRLARRR